MSTIHIVFGQQGAGKTTYSKQLAADENAVLFSIDPWMAQLFGPDLPTPMDFAWIMERVGRCEAQIWATAQQITATGGAVILDLGFMKISDRQRYLQLTQKAGLATQLHYISAPHDIRKEHVLNRNKKQTETFSFEVTPMMFDFMESQFESPNEGERSQSSIKRTA